MKKIGKIQAFTLNLNGSGTEDSTTAPLGLRYRHSFHRNYIFRVFPGLETYCLKKHIPDRNVQKVC